MLIVKPYGRSQANFDSTGENRRAIHLHADPDNPVDTVQFAESHPELVIAQWMSAIDKIATKPSSERKPTTEQRRLRDSIGQAALTLLIEKGLLKDFDSRKDELQRIWWSKIHPYVKGTDDERPANAKGRWYARFAGAADIASVEAKNIARGIYQHLHVGEYRTTSDRPAKRNGRITSRAKSIEKSVLVPRTDGMPFVLPWTSEDERAYAAAGEIAQEIKRAALDWERGRKRVTMRLVAPVLYRHYGRLFRSADGEALTIAAARTEFPGMFELHAAVRDAYARILDGRKKNIARQLPEDMNALFRLIEKKRANRDINALIRLGKVIHYEATPPLGEDSPSNIVDKWPADVSKSRYWTSEGQSEIKRNEAFVRVWRGAIALASRTLTDWADPDGRISRDILDSNSIETAIGTGFDDAAYNRKIELLFGNRAGLFGSESTSLKKDILKLALNGVAELRHSAFHFKGRAGFVNALTGIGRTGSGAARSAAKDLWQTDSQGRAARLKSVMRGAHFDFFFEDEQSRSIFTAVSEISPSHAPLPRFRRVLQRTENAWRHKKFKLRLPAPGNRAELEEPARHCQYTALKLLYERAYPAWLNDRTVDELNFWIDKAVARATEDARKINKDEYAIARAAGLVRLRDGEAIDHFVDQLSAATVTEVRVQRGYDPDPDKAQKKSKYIDDLRCDVVGQAFEEYLGFAGFEWLLDDPFGGPLPDAPLSDLDKLPDAAVACEPTSWEVVLYFLIHLVPVEDVGRLLHQLRKWTVLEGRPSANVQAVERLFSLYLDMHDAKFEGGASLPGGDRLKAIFERSELFSRLFPPLVEEGDDQRVPRRGLREMLRFSDLSYLMPSFKAHPISEKDVEALLEYETEKNGPSVIVTAQERRQALHEKWVKNRGRLSKAERIDYCDALATVARHRHLAAHITLTNHVRLHRLLMQVLGRLVDYSGLWERDLYFVTLALLHLDAKSPRDVFAPGGYGERCIATGQIIGALKNHNETPEALSLISDMERCFGRDFLDGSRGAANIRNDFAHFNILRGSTQALNLTELVNQARVLMSYDRKLKNAVSKSVIEMLHCEGLSLKWEIADHRLTNATVGSRQAIHIGTSSIKENLHGEDFVAMVAALFDGKPVGRRDVTAGLEV